MSEPQRKFGEERYRDLASDSLPKCLTAAIGPISRRNAGVSFKYLTWVWGPKPMGNPSLPHRCISRELSWRWNSLHLNSVAGVISSNFTQHVKMPSPNINIFLQIPFLYCPCCLAQENSGELWIQKQKWGHNLWKPNQIWNPWCFFPVLRSTCSSDAVLNVPEWQPL